MTVKELIDQLSRLDQAAEVMVYSHVDEGGGYVDSVKPHHNFYYKADNPVTDKSASVVTLVTNG